MMDIEYGFTRTLKGVSYEAARERIEAADLPPSGVTPGGKPPQISVEEAMTYRRDVERLFQHGSMVERKQLRRAWVAEMKLAPERREIEITYRVPEPIMKELVAGALYVRIHELLAEWLVRKFFVPRRTRRMAAQAAPTTPTIAPRPHSLRRASGIPRLPRRGPQRRSPGASSCSGPS